MPSVSSMKLRRDNWAAISIGHDQFHCDQAKHIEVDQHFIKQNIEDGVHCMR